MSRGERIQIQGTVQGVGFRPTVARLAQEQGLKGWVNNGPTGVTLLLAASEQACTRFLRRLQEELPPLAKLESIERFPVETTLEEQQDFLIRPSEKGPPQTTIPPDAALCKDCHQEIMSPCDRRFGYAFTSCTHCGPRFSIVLEMPYDRVRTTMQSFPMCKACQKEYQDPQDRRFHAQPIACPDCGPQLGIEATYAGSKELTFGSILQQKDLPPLAKAQKLLAAGAILAIKGLGGYQLCCDATQSAVVSRLRERKQRKFKPFALMARDLDVIESYAIVHDAARKQLSSPAAPIVLLQASHQENKEKDAISPSLPRLAPEIAPSQRKIGLMLPTTPLHQLLLAPFAHPFVCTSGNLTGEPQCIEDEEARQDLGHIADTLLLHDRPIAHRIDDTVLWMDQEIPRMIRRARGYAPQALTLPKAFAQAPPILAMGGQYKATFCMLSKGRALLSPHLGDLEHYKTRIAWEKGLEELTTLFGHTPQRIAVDLHPGYSATQYGQIWAQTNKLPLDTIQHHHAHIAACLAEHNYPLDAPAILGIALDGLGYGTQGEMWGGEFLLADYRSFQRWGCFEAFALLGGDLAARQPWRNLYAHLTAVMPLKVWDDVYGAIPPLKLLQSRPHALLEQIRQRKDLVRYTSSCGRWFDAVAAALEIFPEQIEEEGQAAIALEALLSPETLASIKAEEHYPIDLFEKAGLFELSPARMWKHLCADLQRGLPKADIAARFHQSLAAAILHMVQRLYKKQSFDTVALGGGVWQNQCLLQLVRGALQDEGFSVLIPQQVPTHDGGLSLGQAVIAAARALTTKPQKLPFIST